MAEDLAESYDGVLTDLQALKESGDVWLIRSGGGDIAYPRDNSCQIPMDEDICKLWHEVKVGAAPFVLALDAPWQGGDGMWQMGADMMSFSPQGAHVSCSVDGPGTSCDPRDYAESWPVCHCCGCPGNG